MLSYWGLLSTIEPSQQIDDDQLRKYAKGKLSKFALNAFKVYIGKELETYDFDYDPQFDIESKETNSTSKMDFWNLV